LVLLGYINEKLIIFQKEQINICDLNKEIDSLLESLCGMVLKKNYREYRSCEIRYIFFERIKKKKKKAIGLMKII